MPCNSRTASRKAVGMAPCDCEVTRGTMAFVPAERNVPMADSAASSADPAALRDIAHLYDTMTREIGKVIVVQKTVVEQLVMALLSNGHCLVESVTGLG